MLLIVPRKLRHLLGASLALAFVACDNPAGPSEDALPAPPDVRPWVTGNAAAQVDVHGHFKLSVPVAAGREPIISPQYALDLGRAFVRTWLWEESAIVIPGTISGHQAIQEVHGSPIPWRRLEPVHAMLYFAESPYEPLPEDVRMPVRRVFSPFYLMPLAADGVLVASLAIAAYSTDLSIASEGNVVLPRISGGEFKPTGIPLRDQRPIPVWPEEAVRQVATTTGARITEVPRLVTLHHHYSPHFARWELKLDRPVRLRNSETGQEQHSSTIYVGLWTDRELAWFVPQETQPTEEPFTYPFMDEPAQTIMLRFRSDVPVWYDPVVPG